MTGHHHNEPWVGGKEQTKTETTFFPPFSFPQRTEGTNHLHSHPHHRRRRRGPPCKCTRPNPRRHEPTNPHHRPKSTEPTHTVELTHSSSSFTSSPLLFRAEAQTQWPVRSRPARQRASQAKKQNSPEPKRTKEEPSQETTKKPEKDQENGVPDFPRLLRPLSRTLSGAVKFQHPVGA